MVRRLAWVTALAALLGLGLSVPNGARADAPYQDPRVAGLVQRLVANPAAPNQYSADVKLHVRLRVFPWISLTLKGSQVYKHPGFYHFVFRGVPKAAQQFSDMAYDVGDVGAWPQKYEVSFLETTASGQPVLRLVPKTRGLVKTIDVTIDPQSARLERWVWSRHDGGVITVTQRYQTLQTHDVVAQQDASIRIPHMNADLTATYSNFALLETPAAIDRP